MALFKRRRDSAEPAASASDAPASEAVADPEVVTVPAAGSTDAAGSGPEAPAAAAPAVGISVSSFGGFGSATQASATQASGTQASAQQGATAPPAATSASAPGQAPATRTVQLGPEVAPAATETLPGIRDNTLLRDALAQLPASPTNEQLAAAARNLLQGHLFLRVKGDARALLSEGKELPLAVATRGDEQFVLVYSSGSALGDAFRADGDADTSAMGQPIMTVLRFVLASPYAGIIIDGASAPARAVYPRALLERVLAEADPELGVKTLLAGERTPETAGLVAEAITRAQVWLAVNDAPDGRHGVAEARTPEGERFLEVYSHPLEVIAMGRGDRPAPLTGEQLAKALGSDEALAGVIVDPAGPWIRLTRDDLAPLLTA